MRFDEGLIVLIFNYNGSRLVVFENSEGIVWGNLIECAGQILAQARDGQGVYLGHDGILANYFVQNKDGPCFVRFAGGGWGW